MKFSIAMRGSNQNAFAMLSFSLPFLLFHSPKHYEFQQKAIPFIIIKTAMNAQTHMLELISYNLVINYRIFKNRLNYDPTIDHQKLITRNPRNLRIQN